MNWTKNTLSSLGMFYILGIFNVKILLRTERLA